MCHIQSETDMTFAAGKQLKGACARWKTQRYHYVHSALLQNLIYFITHPLDCKSQCAGSVRVERCYLIGLKKAVQFKTIGSLMSN